MQTTMELLDRALEIEAAPYWHRELKLSRNTLHAARYNGRLSPIMAGAIAIKLGEDPLKWVGIALTEGEKESGAKEVFANWLQKNGAIS